MYVAYFQEAPAVSSLTKFDTRRNHNYTPNF